MTDPLATVGIDAEDNIVFGVDPATMVTVTARREGAGVRILDTHYPRRLYDIPAWTGGAWLYYLAPGRRG